MHSFVNNRSYLRIFLEVSYVPYTLLKNRDNSVVLI